MNGVQATTFDTFELRQQAKVAFVGSLYHEPGAQEKLMFSSYSLRINTHRWRVLSGPHSTRRKKRSMHNTMGISFLLDGLRSPP